MPSDKNRVDIFRDVLKRCCAAPSRPQLLKVYDVRRMNYDTGKREIPDDTDNPRCDRCKRYHALVWVVKTPDGKTHNVGSTCAKRMFDWEPSRAELSSKMSAARKEQKADDLKREHAWYQNKVAELVRKYSKRAKEGIGSDTIAEEIKNELKKTHPHLKFSYRSKMAQDAALRLKQSYKLSYGATSNRRYTCKYCKRVATKGLVWADGRGVIPVCDEHEKRGRHRIEVKNDDEVAETWKLEDGRRVEKASTPDHDTASDLEKIQKGIREAQAIVDTAIAAYNTSGWLRSADPSMVTFSVNHMRVVPNQTVFGSYVVWREFPLTEFATNSGSDRFAAVYQRYGFMKGLNDAVGTKIVGGINVQIGFVPARRVITTVYTWFPRNQDQLNAFHRWISRIGKDGFRNEFENATR